ncbi:predicted protein [Postia placenta Mad-698-R]|nr:predicted protein [Postia placenta Mad-698-R]
MSTAGASSTIPGEFGADTPQLYTEHVPDHLRRATARLRFPPSYVVVAASANPGWHSQLLTDATLFFASTQLTAIITYFVSHGLRIARERAYAQTIESRGKGSDFWQPYVEEWDNPPQPSGFGMGHLVSGVFGRIAFKLLLLPVETVPLVGIMISAWFRALGTSRYLHKASSTFFATQYFKAKDMTHEQISVFMEERKWDYRAFGFAAALLERIPLLGLVFSVSNRIGAAMWAVDLEKRQHYIAEMKKTRSQTVLQ